MTTTTDNELPKMLIVGGSNSIKYTPEVASFLAGKAVVERVPDNARSTRYTIDHIEDWLGSGRWRVIHFNWGMHDLTRVDGKNPQVSLDEYANNLEVLVPRLSRAGERLIWASIMSILPERQPRRRLEDIGEYNRTAVNIISQHGVRYHDLYSFTSERPHFFGADGVHFTDVGYRALGSEVGGAILEALAE